MIRKYDKEGHWVADIPLENTGEPVLLTANLNGEIVLYDRASSELILIEQSSAQRSFGRFDLSEPEQLSCNRNTIWVYDKANNSTLVYDNLGQFLAEHKGWVQITQRYGVITSLPHRVTIENKVLYASADPINTTLVCNSFCIILHPNCIEVFRLSDANQ
ncbi:MAG: hypothetical protein K8S56_00570 [Candidatus Cloacimonetes bacterium]|nr:hypothetical protein [Candidatus Cloacimonadota bacterium]